MTAEALEGEVADLLMKTGHAHHAAFEATDGNDPEWPLWYARNLEEPLQELLGAELTQSRIVFHLLRVEDDRAANAPDAAWPAFYAKDFVARLAGNASP